MAEVERMEGTQANDRRSPEERLEWAIRQTAPGTSLRQALDMIIAGHLGALICIGDADNVIAAGGDGFKLDISFTANRLFELSKMDGAIVLDRDITRILRANYHLNPDASLPTSETGMRHRTAARMSLLTDALVVSISERRQVITLYVNGESTQLRTVTELIGLVNQLLVSMQSVRTQLERKLQRLSSLELDEYVTVRDVSEVIYLFEVLMTAVRKLNGYIEELGSEGTMIEMQRDELLGDLDDEYTLLIRDYAMDPSEDNAQAIRWRLAAMRNEELRSPKTIARVLGYEESGEVFELASTGRRALSNASVVREAVAERLVDEYGSLSGVLAGIKKEPEHLGELGVPNPDMLADRLHRMRKERA
jgi:diadenylate cyclase